MNCENLETIISYFNVDTNKKNECRQMKYQYLTKNVIPAEITIVKAKSSEMWDYSGKKYLDFSAQTLNLNLGNSPKIAKKAFSEQFKKFTFLSSRFGNEVFLNLSKELIKIAPQELKKVNIKLTNGSDANESAFKRARIYSKKPYIISFYYSHLGESCETLKANGKHFSSSFFGGSNYFIHIIPPFLNIRTEAEVLEEIEFTFKSRDDIAAIIIEPIMVNAGVYIFSKSFLKHLRFLCDTYKITLIFDEIQTAFGWLGKMFAAEYFDVCPDILTIGKAFAAGFPLAGVLLKDEYDVLDYGFDEFTYGGHPISCAIALQNIEYLTSTKILSIVNKKSNLMQQLLQDLQRSHNKIIKPIRICGLIAGIEFTSNKEAKLLYHTLIEQGLIVRKSMDGSGPSLVLKPPITVSRSILKKAVKILGQAIKIAFRSKNMHD